VYLLCAKQGENRTASTQTTVAAAQALIRILRACKVPHLARTLYKYYPETRRTAAKLPVSCCALSSLHGASSTKPVNMLESSRIENICALVELCCAAGIFHTW
jgi:hypothetical protein